jgi:hypothetical protein
MSRGRLLLGMALVLGAVTVGCRSENTAANVSTASVEAKIQEVENNPKIPAQVKKGIIAGIKAEAKAK